MRSRDRSLDALRDQFDALVRPFDVHPAYKRLSTSPTRANSPCALRDGGSGRARSRNYCG